MPIDSLAFDGSLVCAMSAVVSSSCQPPVARNQCFLGETSCPEVVESKLFIHTEYHRSPGPVLLEFHPIKIELLESTVMILEDVQEVPTLETDFDKGQRRQTWQFEV